MRNAGSSGGSRGRPLRTPEQPGTCAPRPSQRLGLAYFVLGGLALPMASLSWLPLLAIPLVGLGAVLGVVVLVYARKDEGRASLLALGLVACLLGLLVGAWSIRAWVRSWKGAGKQRGQRAAGGAGARPGGIPAVGLAMREAVQKDGVRVRVVRASMQVVPIEDRARGRRWAERGQLPPVDLPVRFCDGSVRSLVNSIDPNVLGLLACRDDGQVIPNY